MVSSKKKRLTSAAGMNLGAIVTSTKGIATQRIHIKGIINRSLSIRAKLSIKNKAKVATNNFPNPNLVMILLYLGMGGWKLVSKDNHMYSHWVSYWLLMKT